MKKPDLDIQKILFPIFRFEGIKFLVACTRLYSSLCRSVGPKSLHLSEITSLFMIFGHNCSCPITRDCSVVYTNLFVMDKSCLMVISNYEFQTRSLTAPYSHKISQISQMKNGNPCLLPTSQKTIFDFFLIFEDISSIDNGKAPKGPQPGRVLPLFHMFTMLSEFLLAFH